MQEGFALPWPRAPPRRAVGEEACCAKGSTVSSGLVGSAKETSSTTTPRCYAISRAKNRLNAGATAAGHPLSFCRG